jgi:4-amino-4-deoxy-L-arabinose transferase-like glycosyltransferase
VIALTARLSQAWEGPYVTAAASRPRLLLAGLIGLHVLCWTLLPLLTHPNAPLDVVEGAAWGRAWQWGYHKGPPLFAWIMGALDPLPGPLRLAAVYLVSQLAIALTFFGVWQLGVRVFSRVEALLGVMLLEGVYYFTFPTPELNEIVLQMPVSALLGWIFHRAMSEERTADWVAVGALAALGMYARYSTAMLLLALGCFLLLTPARRCLRRAGPYLALAIFLLLWSPHLLWI